MDDIKEYGWAIHLGVLPDFKIIDEIEFATLTFNLVRLGATALDTTHSHWISDDLGPQCDSDRIINDDLMFPWNWKETEWVLYSGDIKIDNIKQEAPCNPIKEIMEIKTPLEEEVKVKVSKCNHPLSVKAEYTDGKNNNQSIPHAIAPLTHMPEPISNQVFKMSGFLKVEKSKLTGANLSIFPAFNCSDKLYEILTTNNFSNYSRADYKKLKDKPNLAFYCNSLVSLDDAVNKVKSQVYLPLFSKQSENEYDIEQVRSQAISNLNPLAIIKNDLVQWLEKAEKDKSLKLPNFDYKFALIKALGLGWEASRKVKENSSSPIPEKTIYPHVFEFLLEMSKAENIELTTRLISSDNRKELITKLKSLDTKVAFVDLIKQADNLSKTLEKKLKILNKNNELIEEEKTDKAFAQAWIDVANMADHPEEGKKLYALFWTVLLTSLNVPNINILPPINNLLDKLSNELVQRTRAALIFEGYESLGNFGDVIFNLIQNGVVPVIGIKIIDSLKTLVQEFLIDSNVVDGIYSDFIKNLNGLKDKQVKSVNHDSGIALNFSNPNSTQSSTIQDQDMRGYAIALQSGLTNTGGTMVWDEDRANWITDTKVLLTEKNNKQTLFEPQMHEAVGATLANGMPVISREYTGRPLNAHLIKVTSKDNDPLKFHYVEAKEEDFDKTDALDYVWPITDNLPLLGYGMFYKGLATPIGNAGEVKVKKHRESDCLSKLNLAKIAIKEIDDAYKIQYLSKIPPGAPVLINKSDKEDIFKKLEILQELSEETRAHAFQVQVSKKEETNKIFPVTLLTNFSKEGVFKDLSKDKIIVNQNKVELEFICPIPSAEFLVRWLNTDILAKNKNTSHLSELFKKVDEKDIHNIRDTHVEKIQNRVKDGKVDSAIDDWLQKHAYHPAITHIGFETEEYKNNASNPKTTITVIQIIKEVVDNKEVQVEKVKYSVGLNGGNLTLTPGSYCRLRVYSLVQESLFTGENKRFDIVLTGKQFSEGGNKYRGFGSLELWFEAAPEWADSQLKIDFNPEINAESPKVANLMLNSGINADWLRGIYIEHHEWHWTGYPITFPKVGAELKNWLNAFVGVESFRDSHSPIFNTYIDANNEWKIGTPNQTKMVIHPQALSSGARPARYLAYTVRPVVRFSKWLEKAKSNGPLELESKIFATGNLIHGISPSNSNERLPVPPLKWTIPLTATYVESINAEGEPLPTRSANGNMLIFDEAIRRTDSLTRFGGIGDTLEIDLMETRVSGINEIGVNPILHALTDSPAGINLEYDKPFGLTYDITNNAKVAQTGMIVRPMGADGKWILAKIRTRRLILPETILKSEIKPENRIYKLVLRQVGDEKIPLDFCIDSKNMKINSITIDSLEIKIPFDIQQINPSRLLCSFHKGYWNSGKATWRLQVLAQTKDEDSLAWKNEYGKRLSCENNVDNKDLPNFINEVQLTIQNEQNQTNDLNISSVCMSDYTDPIWLTFIGSFGVDSESIGDEKDYQLKNINGESLELQNLVKSDVSITQYLINTDNIFLYMLMVFRPISDISLSENANLKNGGQFIGFYKYDQNLRFIKLKDDKKDTLDGCSAYLCKFHITSSLTKNETVNFSSTTEFIDKLMFPPQGNEWDQAGKIEALVRLLPEYLGPIKIVQITTM